MSSLDFYFDFSSPYGYIASHRIDELAQKHGRECNWHPYLMGAAFKRTGRAPLVDYDLVSNYSRLDIQRSARLYNIEIRMPSKFPVPSISACRIFYFLNDNNKQDAKLFARAVYKAYFVDDINIADKTAVLDIAAALGHDAESLTNALRDPGVKERLRHETDAAIDAGVFGSPFVVVDGEPFWGADRLDQIDRWLQTGGW